jgi:peptide/nickel transport system ATP-binding protein
MTDNRIDFAIEDLKVAYRKGARPAVAGVSLRVAAGEALGIVGESGCGKSTLIMAALGLLDPATTDIRAASVRIGDVDLIGPAASAGRRAALGRRIGVVFQNPLAALNPVLTIGHQLTDHMRWHLGLSADAAKERAIRLLEEVGIVEPARRLAAYPHEFSGGMLQRVTIAMALACDPEFLIADEPTTALDATVQAEIVDLIMKLRRERGLGLIWITHDLALLSQIADRVAVMYAGRVIEVGATKTIYDAPSHPYARALLDSVRSLWSETEGPFRTIRAGDDSIANDIQACDFAPRCERRREDCARRPVLMAQVEAGHEVACRYPLHGAMP